MEHRRHRTQATLTVQIRSGPHRLQPPCGFPVALRINPKILAMAHEALLHHPAPATSPCAPSVWKTSCQPQLVPQASAPWRHPPCPAVQSSPSPSPAPSCPVLSSFLALTSL